MRRRTLVDRLQRRITEAEPYDLDWTLEVRLACQRQDMEWELAAWDEANRGLDAAADDEDRPHDGEEEDDDDDRADDAQPHRQRRGRQRA